MRKVPCPLVSFSVPLFSVSERSEKAKRQRAGRLDRHLIVLGTVLVVVSLAGFPQEPPRTGPTVTLAIEVSLQDGSVFYIPALGYGELAGIVPSDGHFAGIRIKPRMLTDSVQIEVSALLSDKKRLSEATCDEIQSWNSESAGSYETKENASLVLSGLGRLGLPNFQSESRPSHWTSAWRLSPSLCQFFLPSAVANIPNPDPSPTPMGGPLAEWRGLCLTLTLGNACRLADVVSVVGPPQRHRSNKHP